MLLQKEFKRSLYITSSIINKKSDIEKNMLIFRNCNKYNQIQYAESQLLHSKK